MVTQKSSLIEIIILSSHQEQYGLHEKNITKLKKKKFSIYNIHAFI